MTLSVMKHFVNSLPVLRLLFVGNKFFNIPLALSDEEFANCMSVFLSKLSS